LIYQIKVLCKAEFSTLTFVLIFQEVPVSRVELLRLECLALMSYLMTLRFSWPCR